MNPGKSKLDRPLTDPEALEGILRRFKRIEGQVRGLQRMAEEGRPSASCWIRSTQPAKPWTR